MAVISIDLMELFNINVCSNDYLTYKSIVQIVGGIPQLPVYMHLQSICQRKWIVRIHGESIYLLIIFIFTETEEVLHTYICADVSLTTRKFYNLTFWFESVLLKKKTRLNRITETREQAQKAKKGINDQ